MRAIARSKSTYLFLFSWLQYGASYPDVGQDKLEITKEVEAGVRAYGTSFVQVYKEDVEIYFGNGDLERLRRFITKQLCN